jgi:hypothetical protein
MDKPVETIESLKTELEHLKLHYAKQRLMLDLTHKFLGIPPLPGAFAYMAYPDKMPKRNGPKYRTAKRHYMEDLEELNKSTVEVKECVVTSV